jgi:cytochrome c oxidase cbb3-type subunit 4
MDYETFRHFSDSWGLLYLFVVFVVVAAFVFRPGTKKHYEDAANIPLKRD